MNVGAGKSLFLGLFACAHGCTANPPQDEPSLPLAVAPNTTITTMTHGDASQSVSVGSSVANKTTSEIESSEDRTSSQNSFSNTNQTTPDDPLSSDPQEDNESPTKDSTTQSSDTETSDTRSSRPSNNSSSNSSTAIPSALPTSAGGPLVAFPGAQGFGKDATGGRGGEVLYVTNLDDSGPGSFSEAAEASGTRNILFQVSGTIALESPVTMRNGDLTIAGQPRQMA